MTLDLIGGRSRREEFADNAAAHPQPEYGFMPRLLAFKFFFIQGLMLYYVRTRHSAGPDVVILAVLVGLHYGFVGIAVAHESWMHRSGRYDRWLGDILLCLVTYPQFSIEHVFGHHIKVATPEDPASARLGEPLYAFVPRSIFGGLASAWEIELRRLKSRGQGWLSMQNRMLWYLVLVITYYVAAYLFCGVFGIMAVVIQSAVAIFSLETINYMQHYGLRRKELSPGRYERPDVHHSWNWEIAVSSASTSSISGRHLEHHRSAGRRPRCAARDRRPAELPGGLIPLYLAAMNSPLWFAIMNPRVAAVSAALPGIANPAPAPRAERRDQFQGAFDRWGGYLMAGLILAMGLVSSRFGFQNSVLFGMAVAVALIAFREIFSVNSIWTAIRLEPA